MNSPRRPRSLVSSRSGILRKACSTAATSTEVSICRPCRVIAISPGRSAIQTKPKAASATAARKMRTRIIAQPVSRRGFQRRNRVGGKLAARLDGLGARLGLGGPGLQWGLGTDVGGELLQLGQRRRDIALPGAPLDPGQHRDAVI